ncbi:MAG: DUF2309 domain-containing protein [Candidatus Rariloculaceae bacterium]
MAETSTLHQQIEEAAQPVSQFWPMKGFVSHNPIMGLEHLPFDEAAREAKHLFGADAYLPVEEHRDNFRSGRITERSVDRALERVGLRNAASISLASGEITAAEVQRIHLLNGIDALEPALFEYQFTTEGVLSQPREGASTDANLGELWRGILSALDLVDPRFTGHDDADGDDEAAELELPFRRALSDWVDELTGSSIVATVDSQVIKWVASFVDEGMAGWEMPGKHGGFYAVWRELAQHDASGRLLGIADFNARIAALPEDPEGAIQHCLEVLEVPQARWPDYLTRMLAQLPGWTGLIRWRGLNPGDPIQKANPIDVTQYLAMRMFYEAELVGVEAQRRWKVAGTLPAIIRNLEDRGETADASVGANKSLVCRDAWRLFHLAQFLGLPAASVHSLTKEQASTVLSWLDEFPAERQKPVWLEAYEDSYRSELLSNIAAKMDADPEDRGRPLAQAAFCIDVRSEPFRRNFEQTGVFETFGYAGFFGIPLNLRRYDTEESFPMCPVLLVPSNEVVELPRSGQEPALETYASGSRWKQFGEQLFHDLKHNPVAAFLLVDVLGLLFSVALLGKTIVRRPYEAFVRATRRLFLSPVVTEMKVGSDTGESPKIGGLPIDLTRGYSVEQQTDFVEGGLRTVGLTDNFGRFFVLCGHGSETDNNPYYAALDCGACGGRHGDANARSFATMANSPEVRAELSRRGIDVPDDTWFLPARHNTTTDRIDFYDLVDLPESHREDLEKLRQCFIEGGEQQALIRCSRIPGTPRGMTAKQAFKHVEARAFDWANTRPEWGLSGNAGFIIARRALTKDVDLGGRCFLHSYDASTDPEGAILERIMTAPLVVGEWINMQYYTSATDPWKLGSGSKVIHNIVGGVGVMYGAQSDLATGLPLQTVNNGAEHFHEPVRLLTIIEAKPEIISAIIGRHEILQQFFHNGWLNLVARNPETSTFHRYNTDASWELVEL